HRAPVGPRGRAGRGDCARVRGPCGGGKRGPFGRTRRDTLRSDVQARPRVLLFGTSDSFARGASDLFGYSPQTAAYVSQMYGGIFDRGTLTIAVNWSSGGRDRMSAAVEHELTHLMTREVTQGRDLPVWLDEGIASLIEQSAQN